MLKGLVVVAPFGGCWVGLFFGGWCAGLPGGGGGGVFVCLFFALRRLPGLAAGCGWGQSAMIVRRTGVIICKDWPSRRRGLPGGRVRDWPTRRQRRSDEEPEPRQLWLVMWQIMQVIKYLVGFKFEYHFTEEEISL